MNSSHDKKRKGGRKKDKTGKGLLSNKSDNDAPNTPSLNFKNPPNNNDIFSRMRLDNQLSYGKQDDDLSSFSSEEAIVPIKNKSNFEDLGQKIVNSNQQLKKLPLGPSPLLTYWSDALRPLASYSAPSPAFWKFNKRICQASKPSDLTASDAIFSSGRKNTLFMPFKRSSEKSKNQNLYFHEEVDINIPSLGKRKLDELSPVDSVDLDSTKKTAHTSNSFNENLAWSYYESKSFPELMNYLESNPIVYPSFFSKLIFFRINLKMLRYFVNMN